jgi:hypothetical protein
MNNFSTDDMINFIKWYDNKPEDKCHITYQEELMEWLETEQKLNIHSVSSKRPSEVVEAYKEGFNAAIECLKSSFDVIQAACDHAKGG